MNDLQQDKREVLAIVNKDVKRTLGVNMKGFGINMKILDVNIDNMVKMTLPVTAEDSEKREERAAYNYSQYEPYYKVIFVSYSSFIIFNQCVDLSYVNFI